MNDYENFKRGVEATHGLGFQTPAPPIEDIKEESEDEKEIIPEDIFSEKSEEPEKE